MEKKTERRLYVIRYKTPDEKYYVVLATDIWIARLEDEVKHGGIE